MSAKIPRVVAAFRAVDLIRREIDELPAGVPADETVAANRAMAERFREVETGGRAGLYMLCRRLIDEREALATKIESIRQLLINLGFKPEARKRNRGPGARGSDTKGGAVR